MSKSVEALLVAFIRNGYDIDMFHHDGQFPGYGGDDMDKKIEQTKNLMQAQADSLLNDYGIDVHTFDNPDFKYEESDMLTFTDEDVQEVCQWL